MKKTLVLTLIALVSVLFIYQSCVKKVKRRYTNLTLTEAFTMMKDPNVIILDVRSSGEFNNTSDMAEMNIGRIKGAINVPVDDISDNLDKLEKYKDKKIVVYCSHAQRSVVASKKLSANGFKHVYNMLGGLTTVKAASDEELPLKKDLYIP
jgi:rhodanese-related sulfurtransferase